MAYVYQNGSLGGARARAFGLGSAPSYEQSYASYLQAHDAWLGAVNVYRSASAAWAAGEAQKSKIYAAEQAAYKAAVAAAALDQQRWASQKAALISQGVTFPSGFPGCVSQAQRDAWQATCNQLSSVKGLGLLSSSLQTAAVKASSSSPSGSPCLLATIPTCKLVPLPPRPPVPAPAPTPPGPEPQPPVKPATPPPPVQVLIPTPTPQTSIPTSIPQTPNTPSGGGGDGSFTPSTPTTSSTVPAAKPKSGGLLSSGLILIVIAGGGYALYRTFKKPRA